MHRRLVHARDRVAGLAGRRVLTDPARPLRELERRLDAARARLGRAVAATDVLAGGHHYRLA
jgi:hypothetical protein